MAQGNGQPLTKESFGNWFGEACKGAGLKGYNAHFAGEGVGLLEKGVGMHPV